MTKLVAQHTVVISSPYADLVFTGYYKSNGDPIVKKASLDIQPGSFFEMADAAEVERLIALGAARLPTDQELAVDRVIPNDFVPFRELGAEMEQ